MEGSDKSDSRQRVRESWFENVRRRLESEIARPAREYDPIETEKLRRWMAPVTFRTGFVKPAPASNAEREPELWAIFKADTFQWGTAVMFLRTQNRKSDNPGEESVRIFPAPKKPVQVLFIDDPLYEG